MNVAFHKVHPALSQFVEVIMCVNRGVDDAGEFLQTSLPNHECFLSFEYETDFMVRTVKTNGFVEAHTTTIIPPQLDKTELKGKTMKAIMVKFRHGGFFRLFKIPMPLFKNDCYNARDVLNKDFGDLFEQILNAEPLAEKINLVELFLLARVANATPVQPIDYAFEKLLCSNGNIPIHDIASIACMSIRQLQRRFLDHFGMSPKHYSKLVRFTTAYRMRTSLPQLTWSEISMRCGYYDQMHLIRDFRTFAAFNPGELDMNGNSSSMLLFPDHSLQG
ncbi:helix-turn-helix domain-containing protein [Pseudobacter ginsenosidimutans]|uniref:Helix-turn-helix protein n=1 Tax=Pseudobacter ginsenosidimutans TaxID=661488 RepID=A0A4Q7M7D7_9BACT|nr:helix-turn-helix domain-containing protein [Pseudobacter ginsenosidimutans]QEC42585.1 AraC family transcriptional regulator [Pseudobacter ginsenosidimutans]RZS63926.1 helix-turn-helix protein [Pseudobacter ginsenosidimutans]